jgi:hypothetical protein
MKQLKLCAALLTLVAASLPATARAGINGWFDQVNVAMVDTAHGWICTEATPWATPASVPSLVVKTGQYGNQFHSEYPLNQVWGSSRPDAAYRCNGYPNVGWSIFTWLPNPVWVYYKDALGQETLLPGSPIYSCGVGTWPSPGYPCP